MSLTDIMSYANVTIFAEIALLIFAVTFSAIVIHTWRRPRSDVARLAAMALESDAPNTTPHSTAAYRTGEPE